MRHCPVFSIVIPTRNRAHLLPNALRSALEQRFDDYEVVVAANNCQDDTRQVVERFQDERIRYSESDVTLSMPDNWERAWSLAEGKYVTYLPDDDALVPTALASLASSALDGDPPVVSWEDAPYYYPDWHDPEMRNLLLLFFHGQQLVEDVPAEYYRRQCASFTFAWSSPLPKLLNCVANRQFFDLWRDRLGELFFPIAPDYSFAWIASHVCPQIRVLHRPLSVRGISDHSIGSNAGLGPASTEFFNEFGDLDFLREAPLRIPTSVSHLAATFQRVSKALDNVGVRPEQIDLEGYLTAVAGQIRESSEVLPAWREYIEQVLVSADRLAADARQRVRIAALSPGGEPNAAPSEGIRAVRDRTARMALADAATLERARDEDGGDEQCARCRLGLETGVLAAPDWSTMYVFGEEVGASDPHALARRVDDYYDVVTRCRGKRGHMFNNPRGATYQQDTEIDLLVRVMERLENRVAIDVGAEKGTFVRAFLAGNAGSVFAVEPHPASAQELRKLFEAHPSVHVLEVALGARDEVVPFYIAEDKTGQASEAYHSLVPFEETAMIRRVGELEVQCRTLGSLVEEGVLPARVGVLKIDTERNDFVVLQGMGPLLSSTVLLEFWDDLPETVGPTPYRLDEVVAWMRPRGYSNFAVVKRSGEFETLQLNDARTRPGEWGNVLFVHDAVFARVAPVLFDAAAAAQSRLVQQAEMFAAECRQRLDVIDQQQQRIESLEQLEHEARTEAVLDVAPEPPVSATAAALDTSVSPAEGSSEALHALLDEQAATLRRLETRVGELSQQYEVAVQRLEADQESRTRQLERDLEHVEAVADARLRVIDIQERTLARYRWIRPRLALERWTAPRIGQLYQYAPRDLDIPPGYVRVAAPSDGPSISIVTPSMNQGNFIERTLRSVVDQHYPRLEYIVKDGGSTDRTSAVVESYLPAIKHFESVPDSGFANGLNVGFEHATGEIMAYLNSDDILLPGAINYVANYFREHPEVDVVYGHRVVIDEYDQEIGRWVLPGHDDEVLSWADYVPQETLFWRRRIWEDAGGMIDESFRFAIDWDLLIRFRDAGARMARLPRFLGGFRVHPHQKTSKEMADIGVSEMDRLRERCHGRRVTRSEISRALRPYLRRHFVHHKLYRLGVLRY